MNKSRSRSVVKKINLPDNIISIFPLPEKVSVDSANESYSLNRTKINVAQNKNLKESNNYFETSFDKSSSSSISWGEEYETDATQKVQKEYERMQNVLSGIEPIPENYDAKEYKLWMKTFPNLNITGKGFNITSRQTQKSSTNYEEVLAEHTDYNNLIDRNKSATSLTSPNKRLVGIIISKVLDDISYKLVDKEQPEKSEEISNISRPQANLNTCLENDFNQFLRISPTPIEDCFDEYGKRSSSKSVSQSHFFASRWLKEDDSPVYTSLPFITIEEIQKDKILAVSAKIPEKRYKSVTAKTRDNHALRRNKYITLPPINDTSLTISQFRSISATPRNKALLTPSFQRDTLLTSNSRFDVANYIVESEISKRQHNSKIKKFKRRL